MLVELNLVEQRYQAVLEVLEGATVTDVARRHGVVRQTVHEWLRRYAADGRGPTTDFFRLYGDERDREIWLEVGLGTEARVEVE